MLYIYISLHSSCLSRLVGRRWDLQARRLSMSLQLFKRYSTYVLVPSRFSYTDLESEKPLGAQSVPCCLEDQRDPRPGGSTFRPLAALFQIVVFIIMSLNYIFIILIYLFLFLFYLFIYLFSLGSDARGAALRLRRAGGASGFPSESARPSPRSGAPSPRNARRAPVHRTLRREAQNAFKDNYVIIS